MARRFGTLPFSDRRGRRGLRQVFAEARVRGRHFHTVQQDHGLHIDPQQERHANGNRPVNAQTRRIAELERLIGKQQAEIRFLDKALRRVEELRQQKNDDGVAASSKS